MKPTYLLIGGGLASHSAVKTICKGDADAKITIVTNEPHLPYNRPPLSKDYLKGKLAHERLFFDPQSFYDNNHIQVIFNQTVEALDLSKSVAHIANGESIQFGKALIATGGRPVTLPIPGSDLAGVTYLRTLDDTDAIATLAKKSKKAVIIGGGFIGLELAASLTALGIECHVVELQPRIWSDFAPEILSSYFQKFCSDNGVQFHLEDNVTEIFGHEGKVAGVHLESNQEIYCEMLCIGVGIIPNIEVASASGLKVDNGIVVDEYLRTSHTDVYAVGDVSNYIDSFTGKRKRVEHWGHAKFSGQCAAENMMGNRQKYEFLSYVWSDIFGCRLNFAGDESHDDDMLIRGHVAAGSFSILYLKNDLLTGGFTINVKGIEFAMIKRLIQEKTNLSGKMDELVNPEFNLKELL